MSKTRKFIFKFVVQYSAPYPSRRSQTFARFGTELVNALMKMVADWVYSIVR